MEISPFDPRISRVIHYLRQFSRTGGVRAAVAQAAVGLYRGTNEIEKATVLEAYFRQSGFLNPSEDNISTTQW